MEKVMITNETKTENKIALKSIDDCIDFVMGELCSEYESDSYHKLSEFDAGVMGYDSADWQKFAGIVAWQPFENYSYNEFYEIVDNFIESTIRFTSITMEEYAKFKAKLEAA